MPRSIDTADVRRLLENGVQLVEVLPKADYEREHLPGAISIPLPEMDKESVAVLDPNRPVVTYCYDLECDLSPRAATWLEVLGFSDVYDYSASKVAWLAYGLPSEGTVRPSDRAGGRCRADLPLFDPDDDVRVLEGAFDKAPVAVVAVDGYLVAVVTPDAADQPTGTTLRQILRKGASSVRPSITVDELASSMDRADEQWVLVTHLDGWFVGLVERRDLDDDLDDD